MRHVARSPLPLLALVAFLAATASARADVPALNAGEFKLYKEYQAALTDERVQKIPEKKRLSAIARNFGVKDKELLAAIEKGDKAGPDLARRCETEVRALVEAGPLKGRLHDLKVDDTESHVVTYIAWKNKDGEKLEEEAATIALAASKGTPIASTIALWAVDAASGRKVFEAKIGNEAAGRFNAERIPMFASARYIKVFEDVHNAYKGTPPVESTP